MNLIEITPSFKEKCPAIRLGCIACDVTISEDNVELWKQINAKIEELQANLTSDKISKISTITSARKGYKALGKDPSRYRLSAEALLRRVVKKKGLYQINNIVDLLNLVSISTGFSIGGYDADKVEGTITLGIGQENEPYQAIGRGTLNIANLPVFRDEKGAFGTPTSDSQRTMVSASTQRFLMIIVDFGSDETLEEAMALSVALLTNFGGSAIENWVV